MLLLLSLAESHDRRQMTKITATTTVLQLAISVIAEVIFVSNTQLTLTESQKQIISREKCTGTVDTL